MKKKDKKEKKINIKEVWEDPRERATVYLGGYFIFFLIIIVVLRVNYSSNNAQSNKTNNEYKYNYNSDSAKGYSLNSIQNNNYHFEYTENINNQVIIIVGDRYKNKELFTTSYNYIITDYYRDDDIYLTKQNDTWTKVDSPFFYNTLSNYKTIKSILEKATKMSTTEYTNGKSKIKYAISTTTLVKILDDDDIDIADDVNEITIKIDTDKNIYYINYDLSSYLTYKNNSASILDVSLNYSNIGQIAKIETPN